MSVVKISVNKLQAYVPTGSPSKSVVIEGVLLRSPAIFVWVGPLGLALERAICTLSVSLLEARKRSWQPRRSQTHMPSSAPAERRLYINPLRGAERNLQRSRTGSCAPQGYLTLLPDALLGPFQISLCLSCGFEPLCEVRSDTLQTALSESL